LPLSETDPFSGQPGFKDTPARVFPLHPQWRGFLATQAEPALAGLVWWSRARVAGGWLYELAGDAAPDADALLPPGERLEAADLTRGMRRIAVRGDQGTLIAALYLTRSGELPPRDWVAGQLAVAAASAPELLAARPAAPQANRGPIICVCHGIGSTAITGAACGGAKTVEAVGAATLAGTNCGSCRPAIARLLESAFAQDREAV
jgi:assimilatory nitrate reductase catalytic subunit